MNRKDVIKKICKDLGITEDKANEVFDNAVKSGAIKRTPHWKNIIDALIVALLFISLGYCLIKIVISYLY